MKQVRQANKICINRVAGSLKDARFYVALLLFFVMIFSMVSPIRDMALQTGYRSAPWVFPFVVQNYFIQMIVMLSEQGGGFGFLDKLCILSVSHLYLHLLLC